MKNIALLLCFLAFGYGKAQDFKKDLMAVNDKIYSHPDFSLKLHYRMFIDGNMQKAYRERDVFLTSQGANIYCEDEESGTYMVNKIYEVLVNNKLKQIYVTNRPQKEIKSVDFMNMFHLKADSILMIFSKTSYSEPDKETGHYECYLKAGGYSRIDFYYNKSSHALKQIVYYYRGPIQLSMKDSKKHPMAMEISYMDYSDHPKKTEQLFAIQNYLKTSAKGFNPSARYANYHIINEYSSVNEKK